MVLQSERPHSDLAIRFVFVRVPVLAVSATAAPVGIVDRQLRRIFASKVSTKPRPAPPNPDSTSLTFVSAERLYTPDGQPTNGFNRLVKGWLDESIRVSEHATPAAFSGARRAYDQAIAAVKQTGLGAAETHAQMLSNLSDLMEGDDLSAELAERLSDANINEGGVRTALSQGFSKNVGENFINLIAYALADLLEGQDQILVDKGTPRPLKELLTPTKIFEGTTSGRRDIEVKIECDLAIWERDKPECAIVVSGKTRLKEIFHVGTMWKILFDMIGDEHSESKWGLRTADRELDMQYVFATADLIPRGGARTQGPDVERDDVRNLIAMDASFFDYVFVSKTGIGHVASELDFDGGREALFHTLGCLIGLISQKFGLDF